VKTAKKKKKKKKDLRRSNAATPPPLAGQPPPESLASRRRRRATEERAYLSRKGKKEKAGWEMKEISSHHLFICPPTPVFASSRVTMSPHTLPH